ncbi:MAG: DnaB-like helicase C-terminal domain-containing protein [Bacteroidales bacterium]|nr:DnaB-like helicase C-terminal domain-containing protein [Bacteroidales bacterium]
MKIFKDILKATLSASGTNLKRLDKFSNLPSGFPSLDRVTGGLEKSSLTVIASRPSMGKTAFVLSLANNLTMKFNIPTLFFSIEMNDVQLTNRYISLVSKIDLLKIKSGNLDDNEKQQLKVGIGKVKNNPLFFQTELVELSAIANECREFKKQYNEGVIIIDNLQQMNNAAKQHYSRKHELDSVVRELKLLAKEIELPVIITSSVNRNVVTRGGMLRPFLCDLYGSSEIENIADVIIFIYRPEFYGIMEDPEGNSTAQRASFVVAKNRHGSINEVNLCFKAEYGKICEWTL